MLTGKRDLNIRQVQLNMAWKLKGLSSKGDFSVRAGPYNVKEIMNYLGGRVKHYFPSREKGGSTEAINFSAIVVLLLKILEVQMSLHLPW